MWRAMQTRAAKRTNETSEPDLCAMATPTRIERTERPLALALALRVLRVYRYAALQIHNVLPFVQSGGRLPRPALCPLPVYDMMARCWAADAADRPTLQQIAPVLRPQPIQGV